MSRAARRLEELNNQFRREVTLPHGETATIRVVDDDQDSYLVIETSERDWEFAVDDGVAYPRWNEHPDPDWVDPVLYRMGLELARREGRE